MDEEEDLEEDRYPDIGPHVSRGNMSAIIANKNQYILSINFDHT